jgi:FecR protein
MRPLFTLSGALLICTAALAQGSPVRTMTASIVEGTVTVQRGSDGARPLVQGTPLQEGDLIQTGADSHLEISMNSGTTLRVGENAKLELRLAPAAGKAFTARLWLGALWAKVHKLLQDESFQVETENAVAGVRGTEFVVEAGGGSRDDGVRVYEGSVEVRDHAGGWMHRLEAGRELSVRRGLMPEGPKSFDPASDREHRLMRWVREQRAPAPDSRERSEPGRSGGNKQQKEKPERQRHRLFDRFRGR